MGMLHVLFMSYFTCIIPMFRIAAMKAFISTLVTAFHLWKRLFGHKLPWRSRVAIRSVAYLHVEFSKAITGEFCSMFPVLTVCLLHQQLHCIVSEEQCKKLTWPGIS